MEFMVKSGLAFIVSHVDFSGELPAKIIPNYFIRTARDSEIEEIKKLLPNLAWSIQYDSEVQVQEGDGSTSYSFEKLEREKWKYWVIAYEGNNIGTHEIEKFALLLPVEFEVGISLWYSEENQGGKIFGRGSMPLHIVDRYSQPKYVFGQPQLITTEQIASIEELKRLQLEIKEEYSFVNKALDDFVSLRRISDTSPLLVVGYFSIIELLITHEPRSNETLDSITHQITNKIILLRKRYDRKISSSEYFANSAEEVLWKKLYKYRSCLAHGNPTDFTKDFQMLKSQDAVASFLKENVKELIILALKDPEFFSDLRKC